MYLTETYLTEEQGIEKIVNFLLDHYELNYVDEVVEVFESLNSYDMDYILNEDIIDQYLFEMYDSEDAMLISESLDYNDLDYILYEGLDELLTEISLRGLGNVAGVVGKYAAKKAGQGASAVGKRVAGAASAAGRYGRSVGGAVGNTASAIGRSAARGVSDAGKAVGRYGKSSAGALANTGRGLASRLKDTATSAGRAAGRYGRSVAGAVGNTAKDVGRSLSKAAKSTYKKAREKTNEIRGKVTSAAQRATGAMARGTEAINRSATNLGRKSKDLKAKVGSSIANSEIGQAYKKGVEADKSRKAANAAAKLLDKTSPTFRSKRKTEPQRRIVPDKPPQKSDYYRGKAERFIKKERGTRPYMKPEGGRLVARSGRTGKELNKSARSASGFRVIPSGLD